MSLIKKLFVFSLVFTTVLWSIGPVSVSNAAGSYNAGNLLARGDVDGAAVYYIGSDGMKYIFPDGKTYSTWYADFNDVIEVDVAELDMYDDGGTVTYRAGTKLVTHENTAKVYAIGTGGVRHYIPTAAVAEALYGADWGLMVMDVLPGYFSSYAIGADLSDMYPNGTLLQMGEDMYYVMDGDVRPFADADSFEVNSFVYDNLIEVEDVDAYGTGESVTGEETGLVGFMPAEGTPGGDVVVADGDLSVSLASGTPAQMAIPYNVQGYAYTSLRLSAGDTAVDVTGLTIERTGLGDYNDFDKVYVEVDGLRHGTKRTLGSDNETEVYFATATNKITVPANSSIIVDVVADMGSGADDAGHYNALMVTAIVTDATLSVSLPITGNYMTVNSISVATAEITFNGSDGTDVEIGEEQIEVAAMKVDNNSSEDISFEAVVLENTGSADNTEAVNYTLYDESDAVVAGPVNATDGDYIMFTLDTPFEIADGHSEDFVIKADIEKGRTETIILGLEEVTDFSATGLTNGYAVTATDSGVDDTYTIIGGDLTIDEADTNPGTQDLAPQTDDATFLIAELEALEETVVITSSTLTLTCPNSNNCADLENITAYLDGDVVFGPEDGTDGSGALTMAFSEDFEISDTQLFEVTADIGENASGTYSISLASNNAFTAEATNGDALANDPSGSATGNSVVVGVAAGTLSVDGTYGSQNMVAGDEDFLIGRFILEASDYEGISISSYDIGLVFGGGDLVIGDVEELWISEDDDHDTSVTATTTFNVSQELAAGETKTISVYATIDSDYTPADSDDTITVNHIAIETEGLVSEDENTVELSGTAQVITVEAGTLTLSAGADTPDAMTVLAGGTYEVAEWNFETANVGYTINEVVVEAHSGNTTETAAVVSAVLDGVTATAVNGILTFTTDIYVEKDEDLDVVLSATFNDSFNNVASGDIMEFAIVAYDYIADNETSETTSTDYSSTGELMHLRASDVVVTTRANDSTLLATTEMMDITFTADAAGDISIGTSSFTFNFHDDAAVQGSSLTISSVLLKDSNGDTVGTADTTGWNADDDSTFTVVYDTIGETIGAGSSKTYTLEIIVSNYATDDYINVTMLDDSSSTSTYFGWQDEETSADVSGYLVDGIDSPTYEVTR